VPAVSALRPGSVGVRVENRDDRSHAVNAAFRADGEIAAERRFEGPVGDEREATDVVDAAEYAVDVTLDGATDASVALGMRGCTDDTLFAAMDDDGTLEAGVLDECRKRNPQAHGGHLG
jgi:hypothetical protein